MAIPNRDRSILRDLAQRVAEIAARPEQAEKARLWTVCNDLRPERAITPGQLAVFYRQEEVVGACWIEEVR